LDHGGRHLKKKLLIIGAMLVLASALFAIPSFAMPANPSGIERRLTLPQDRIFMAHLTGDLWVSRVAPDVTYGPIMTRAQGEVIFRVNGDEINFILIAANIQNIIMAHIHLDNGSALGPIVVWLYPRMPPPIEIPGRFNGILASGTIKASDLVGPLQGMPISALLEKMENGNAYVVVHTTQHPAGEIRGWIF